MSIISSLRAAQLLWDTKRRVRRHGWRGIYVGDYHNAPTWAYTIGFHSSLGAPEVIVFDLPQATANSIFWGIYRDLKWGGLVIRDGEPWRPEEVEQPLVWRQVHPDRLKNRDPENPWLGLAEDYAALLTPERDSISAFQLVLRDQDGHLPWEAGYDERLRPLQRELYLPAERWTSETHAT